jgi:hypothetical protein
VAYDLYLSYSGRKTYLGCPYKYELRYVRKDKVIFDPRKAMLGNVIGKIFEWFYERRAWATSDPVQATTSWIDDACRVIYEQEHFDPQSDPAFVTLLRQDLHRFVPTGVEIIRAHELLTPQSVAELDLTVEYTSQKHDGLTLKLGGRTDFRHLKSDKSVWLMDGKASKHREKYVDSEQLIWYAVQHYLKYHVAPTRLGFMFWCFPDDPIKWIAYDNQAMRASLDLTFAVAKKIRLKQFDPTPSGECHRCDYSSKCEEGQKYLARRRVETGGRIENSIFDLESV